MRNLSSSRTFSYGSSAPLRAAFTLIELLIVISIISLLIALIAPAIAGVLHRAKILEVQVEIMGLDAAANDFKGASAGKVHPPSSITLYEKGGAWSNSSKRAIRRIFGDEFNFAISRDIDGDGNKTGSFTLNGAECLVFFLGGIPRKDGSGNWVLNGFSKSKSDPFRFTGNERNRRQFFTEWDTGRLSDPNNNGFPVYSDIFNVGEARPYLYASTTRTGSYEVSDINPPMTSVYHQGSANVPWKKSGFQIISPGADHTYGTGGKFTLDGGVFGRDVEKDNITNFGGGALDE